MARPALPFARLCKVPYCLKPIRGGGWGMCPKHYTRWLRYGDENFTQRCFGTKEERFWNYVDKTSAPPSQHRPDLGRCWVWTGSVHPGGYGLFGNGDTGTYRAHRFAYESLKGPISDGMTVDHLCRVKLCVNPDHMEIVSPSENSRRAMTDRWNRKRGIQ